MQMNGQSVMNALKHLLVRNANEQPSFTPNDYAGKADAQNLIRFLAFNGTLSRLNLVTLKTGIKYKQTQIRLEMNAMMGGASADFVTSGQQKTNFTPYVLQPNQYEFKYEQDYNEMYKTWLAEMGGGFAPGMENNRLLPELVMSALMDEVLEQFPLFHDQLYIQGKTTTANANENAYGALASFNTAYKGILETLNSASDTAKLGLAGIAITAIAIASGQIQVTITGTTVKAGDFIYIDGLVDGGGGGANIAALMNKRRYRQSPDAVTPKFAIPIQVESVNVVSGNSVCLLNVKTTDFTNAGVAVTPVIGSPVFANAKAWYVNDLNVQGITLNFWSSLSQVQREDPNFKIWCHPAIYNSLMVSEATRLGGSVLNGMSKTKELLLDEKLVVVPNLPVGTMVGIANNNAEIGVDDTLESFNSLQMKDLFDTDFRKFIRFYAAFSTCVGVPKTREAIILRPI